MRIMRSLKERCITAIAVASEADLDAWHARYADEVVNIGPAPAAESYLVVDKIIAAAKESGADAIHPGYGFLAENADFAERCQAEGIVFIGPTPESIRAMGDKAAARHLAEEAGLPVVPGIADLAHEGDLMVTAAAIGYPLLLKPSAGGGGKGMVIVEQASALDAAAASARRLALAAFGDDRLLLERFVHPARHVEIQVFGDGQGDVVALGERECSLQRRHQKVVEECPSPLSLWLSASACQRLPLT